MSNGDLIDAAERAGFGVLVTADRNLQYQQSLTGRQIAIVVLGTNHWATLRDQPDRIAIAIAHAVEGSFVEVPFDRLSKSKGPSDPSLG